MILTPRLEFTGETGSLPYAILSFKPPLISFCRYVRTCPSSPEGVRWSGLPVQAGDHWLREHCRTTTYHVGRIALMGPLSVGDLHAEPLQTCTGQTRRNRAGRYIIVELAALQRPSEQIALCIIAAVGAQVGELVLVLHTFGHYPQVEAVGEADDRARDGSTILAGFQYRRRRTGQSSAGAPESA